MKGMVLLAIAIVGMFVMPMMLAKVKAQVIITQNKDYTIFTPGDYNYKNSDADVTGGDAFADSSTSTGNIVVYAWGVTGGYVEAAVGERFYIGRNKELRIWMVCFHWNKIVPLYQYLLLLSMLNCFASCLSLKVWIE